MTNLEMALIERVQELENELFEANRKIGVLKDQIGDLNRFYKEGPIRKKTVVTKEEIKEEIKVEVEELEAMDIIEAFAEALKETKNTSLDELEFKQFEEELENKLYEDELDRLEYMDNWIVKYNNQKYDFLFNYKEYNHELDLDAFSFEEVDEIPF